MTPKIQEALNQLVQAIQQETLAKFSSLLTGEDGPIPIPYRRGRGALATPKARRKGGKRTAEEIEGLKKQILSYVRKNPGQRSEQIAKGLNTTTKELQLPMLALREAKALKLKGNRRAASYTAA
jgi:hypothetical protein